MPKQTVYLKLPVELSDEELAKRAAELAAKELEKDRVEEQKKAVGAPIPGLKLAIRRLSQVVDTGTEEQEVPCDQIFDDDRFEVRTIRQDTREQLSCLPYSSSERAEALARAQGELPFEIEPAEAKKVSRGKTLFDAKPPKVGPRDAAPAPDRVEHKGQTLQKLKRGKSKGKAKRGEARA